MKAETQEEDNDQQIGFGIIGFKDRIKDDDKKQQFMNTQKLPSLKSGKTLGLGFGKGGKKLALDLKDDENDMFDQTNSKSKGTRNTFTGIQNKKSTI